MDKIEDKERFIKDVTVELANVINSVINSNLMPTNERLIAENLGSYIPTPFEIAALYGIPCKFIKLNGNIPSKKDELLGTIYISDRYSPNSYEAKYLCAHELGHFFMQDNSKKYSMSKSKNKVIEEYEANIFAILLMPQFMAGQNWINHSPKELNEIVYDKILKRDG